MSIISCFIPSWSETVHLIIFLCICKNTQPSKFLQQASTVLSPLLTSVQSSFQRTIFTLFYAQLRFVIGSHLFSQAWPSEMSGLWNFSVRVQSWSDKIEANPALIRRIFENHQSDPVLIRQCKIMYFYFASWGKRTNQDILPFANYNWLKAK